MTNKKIAATLAAFVGVGATALVASPVSAQAPMPPVIVAQAGHRERHPELRLALRALMRAQMALQHSAHDFDGHRERALDLTGQAIAQVQQALQDDTH